MIYSNIINCEVNMSKLIKHWKMVALSVIALFGALFLALRFLLALLHDSQRYELPNWLSTFLFTAYSSTAIGVGCSIIIVTLAIIVWKLYLKLIKVSVSQTEEAERIAKERKRAELEKKLKELD